MFRDKKQEQAGLFLSGQKRQTGLLQGGTGLGKTFLCFLESQRMILDGMTTLIAVPYHVLAHQTLSKIGDMERAKLDPSCVVHFKSSSTWASPTRAAQYGIEVFDGELCEEVIERCKDTHTNLKPSDICVRSQFCPPSEMAHYQAYRKDSSKGKVIICTHTALLINAWTNNRYLKLENLGRVLVDEADVIGDMAKLLFNRTITKEDFEFLHASKSVMEVNLDACEYYIKRCEAKMIEDEEHALELLAAFKVIKKNLDNRYCKIEKWGPEWRMRFRRPAGILSRLNVAEDGELLPKVTYLSGSLAMREDGFDRFARMINAKEYETCFAVHTQHKSFGKLKFIFAERLTDDECDQLRNYRDDWHWTTDVDLTAACAIKGLETGHTLVLTPSSADTMAIAERLPNAIYQDIGENARHCIKRFVAAIKDGENHHLVGHGLWAGMDISNTSFKHVIIPRIPYQPRDEVDEEENFLSNLDRARRKVSQGIGRAIRRQDDEATIWILDKRFPLPGDKMNALGTNNRLVGSHVPLQFAIASRFDRDYQRAKIAYLQSNKLVIE